MLSLSIDSYIYYTYFKIEWNLSALKYPKMALIVIAGTFLSAIELIILIERRRGLSGFHPSPASIYENENEAVACTYKVGKELGSGQRDWPSVIHAT